MVTSLKFRKILVKGEPGYLFVGYRDVLSEADLPEQYMNGIHFVASGGNIVMSRHITLVPGKTVLTPADYEEYILYMKMCGERLTSINAHIKALQAEWNEQSVDVEI